MASSLAFCGCARVLNPFQPQRAQRKAQYGIILFTFGMSASLTKTLLPNLRLRFLAFEVRMWRRNECPRFTLPVAVFLKRLEAPLCVFSFGMKSQLLVFGT